MLPLLNSQGENTPALAGEGERKEGDRAPWERGDRDDLWSVLGIT